MWGKRAIYQSYIYISRRTCKLLDVMISDNLLDYQYELKPLVNGFHLKKDSDMLVNDGNVRIYLLWICMTFFRNLIAINKKWHIPTLILFVVFGLNVYFYQTTIFLSLVFSFFVLLLLLLVRWIFLMHRSFWLTLELMHTMSKDAGKHDGWVA